MVRNSIDIKGLFLSLQKEFSAELNTTRKYIKHPGAMGAISESTWSEWLVNYLPGRYAVSKGFAIDCEGKLSEEIDIIIYDRYYSPFILHTGDTKYIPVESIFCILEVKQSFTKEHIEYAVKKANSVDSLRVTSSIVNTLEGMRAKEPYRILRGLLATGTEWKEGIESAKARVHLENSKLDFGCAMDDRSFSLDDGELKISNTDECLIFFFLKLMSKLSALGNAIPLSFDDYAGSLDSPF